MKNTVKIFQNFLMDALRKFPPEKASEISIAEVRQYAESWVIEMYPYYGKLSLLSEKDVACDESDGKDN